MSEPTVRPTTARQLLLAGGIGAAVTWLMVQALSFAGASLPQPGPGGWVPPIIMAAITAWLAWITRAALNDHRGLDPEVAVGRLRIAKAGMLVSAFLIAAYLILLVASLLGWPAPLAQSRALHAALAVVACVVWGVAAFALERVCRIPVDPEGGSGEAA